MQAWAGQPCVHSKFSIAVRQNAGRGESVVPDGVR
jgi:hypothetical protein